jgi:hypothetical protein
MGYEPISGREEIAFSCDLLHFNAVVERHLSIKKQVFLVATGNCA